MLARFLRKRQQRNWTKRVGVRCAVPLCGCSPWHVQVKYDVRKNFADSRLRVKGRFVKKEDEELLREIINLA